MRINFFDFQTANNLKVKQQIGFAVIEYKDYFHKILDLFEQQFNIKIQSQFMQS